MLSRSRFSEMNDRMSAAFWLLVWLCASSCICIRGSDENFNVPLEPESGILHLEEGPNKSKYIKEIIWVDDPQTMLSEGKSNPSVEDLRTSLGNEMMSALTKNELVDGVQTQGGKSIAYQPGGAQRGTITLSRDVIPLLLQNDVVSGQSGGSHPPQQETLYLEELVKLKQKEQRRSRPDQISYASASSTESYEEHRPSFAFDGDPNTVWVSRPWKASKDKRPQWIEYSFEEPQAIGEYSLASFPAIEVGTMPTNELSLLRLGGAVFGGPTAWTLACSKDGLNWENLHTIRKVQPWIPGERRTFSVSNLSLWNYCRIYINNVPLRPDGTKQVALSEVTFSKPRSQAGAHPESVGYGSNAGPNSPTSLRPSGSRPLPQTDRDPESAGYGSSNRPNSASILRPSGGVSSTQSSGCVFPFMHNGVSHDRCIPFQSKQWCKTERGSWLVCNSSNSNKVSSRESVLEPVPLARRQSREDPNQRSVSLQERGAGKRETSEYDVVVRECQFPFMHFGSLHDDCIRFEGQYWCKDRHERWLTCKGRDGRPKGPAGTADLVPSNKDWYLSLKNMDQYNQELNVLEMKPHSNNDENAIEYKVCKVSGHSNYKLYIPPQYTRLPLGDDDAAYVKLPQNFTFPFYGESYEDIYVGSNGYITFDLPDTNYIPSEDSHLGKKRISVLFADIDPSEGGEVQFADLTSAVAVTWNNVTVQDAHQERIPGQTFQTILFEDGTIWMGFEQVDTNSTIVGISSGPPRGPTQAEATTDLDSIEECS